jgi:Carboxypeptidase regulatory-like domain
MNRLRADIRNGVMALLLLALGTGPAYAQQPTASITGAVQDSTGAAVPGVSVTVSNPATGQTRSVITDSAGQYAVWPYRETGEDFAVTLNVSAPPNTLLVQGVTTGQQGDNSELGFQLPRDFLSQPFIASKPSRGLSTSR